MKRSYPSTEESRKEKKRSEHFSPDFWHHSSYHAPLTPQRPSFPSMWGRKQLVRFLFSKKETVFLPDRFYKIFERWWAGLKRISRGFRVRETHASIRKLPSWPLEKNSQKTWTFMHSAKCESALRGDTASGSRSPEDETVPAIAVVVV